MQNLQNPNAGTQHLLRLFNMREVQAIAGGKSRSTIWRWVNDPSNSFPAPVKISGHSIAWPEESIIAWRDSVISQEAA